MPNWVARSFQLAPVPLGLCCIAPEPCEQGSGRARSPRLCRAPGRRAAAGRDCMPRWAVGQAISGSEGWAGVIPRCVCGMSDPPFAWQPQQTTELWNLTGTHIHLANNSVGSHSYAQVCLMACFLSMCALTAKEAGCLCLYLLSPCPIMGGSCSKVRMLLCLYLCRAP